ncbi:MAG: hypothetical protein EOP06_18425 [Proteobacteria bacterium]|nr:MAG: hypothetical protein EOP06_18425 [Pseudomonadota bacterium]
MGKTFIISQDVAINELPNGDAQLFVAIANTLSDNMRMKRAISGNPLPGTDYYLVDEESFCLLVERVFEKPLPICTGWARFAAGMYENIKKKRMDWEWPEETSPFTPVRRDGYSPDS